MQQEWRTFLEQQSARVVDDLVTDFGDPDAEHLASGRGNSLYDLSCLDVFQVSGNDAKDFLHGQLSSDLEALAEGQFQLSSWCNIKGRVIAILLLYRSHDCYYLLLEKELSERVIKRLQMFVLRADVTISPANDQLVRLGIKGKEVHESFQALQQAAGSTGTFFTLQLADADPRSLVLCTVDHAISLWQQLAELATPVASRFWLEHDISSGIPWPGEAGSEEFLPQSINLDLLAGLSFNKGCYPGQEIISRMHFRGKLKQRMQLLSVDSDSLPASGTHIYTKESEKHCGTVVRACPVDKNSYLLLAILDIEKLDSTELFLADQDAHLLITLQLPYDIGTA